MRAKEEARATALHGIKAQQRSAPVLWKIRSRRKIRRSRTRAAYSICSRKHYERYTPEMVARICGCKEEEFFRVAETICANSGRERTTCLVYAVGWTQHSIGVQIIRAAGLVQLLLGNIGRPGGGIMAMRGHASIQGSTDVPTLYDLLPGYIPQPSTIRHHTNFSEFLKKETPKTGYLGQYTEVCRQPSQGLVRRGSDQRERLRVRLGAEVRRRLLAFSHQRSYGRRQDKRYVPVRPESGRRFSQRKPCA